MNQNSIKSIITVMVMVAASFAAIVSFSDTMDAAEQEYDVDLGRFYSLKTQLIWDGKDAESIKYEFSDGSEPSTEWNPMHVWPGPGVYYITQTAYNSFDGGSETTTVYRVEIMGYPEVHFETNGGSEVADIEQTAFNVVAAQPEDPVREGYEFKGWFIDEECTQPFDWSQGLKKDITLYAGWEETGTPVEPGPVEDDDDENGFQIELWMIILILLIILIIVAIALWRR